MAPPSAMSCICRSFSPLCRPSFSIELITDTPLPKEYLDILRHFTCQLAVAFNVSALLDLSYSKNFNKEKYDDIAPLQKKLAEVKDNKDSTKLIKEKLQALNAVLIDYKLKFIKENPEHLMANVFKASKDIDVPDAPKLPGGGIDSMFAYKYYKAHYWDNFDLTDDRILRTPIYHPRLENYFKNIIMQTNDSIKANCDDMIERTRPNKEMFKYIVYYQQDLFLIL